jgi:hypothetical protein
MYVQPVLMVQLSKVPYAVLYELVLVDFGEFA